MKGPVGMLLCALLVAALSGWRTESGATERGVCLVCQVMSGKAEAEPIRAVRTHQGKPYGFCSEKCAKAFEADPAAYAPPVFPRPAPSFELRDLTGSAVSSETVRGKVVLVDFWATWCAPCRKSMPALQALHDRFASRGFVVLGISIDEGDPARVRKYVTSKKLTYPIAVDSGRTPAWEAFRVKAVPAAYLLDRDGRIVAQWNGSAVDARDLEARLEELLTATGTPGATG